MSDVLAGSVGPAVLIFAGALVSGLLVPALGLVVLIGFVKKAADAA